MSEQDRSRLYDWWCEHADESLAEYAMSCLSPVPLPELATKDDLRVVKDDLRVVKNDVARIDAKVDALAVRMDQKFDQIIELREIDRKESGRRAWRIALALPVEVVVLLAGAAAVLEWLRG